MSLPRVTIVMPAYNEADGIGQFLPEIVAHVAPITDALDLIVVDDLSTDGTSEAIAALCLPAVTVLRQSHNRGHGPSALAAYAAGLASDVDLIVHVDGDGQFSGSDIARVIEAAQRTGADAVHGVRHSRADPWFRRALTVSLRWAMVPWAGRPIPDINTPLRVYRPDALRALVDAVGPDAAVPHVHFSLAEARWSYLVRYVSVQSLTRRGAQATGTMWQSSGTLLPPKRLRRFVVEALVELWNLSLAPRAPLRTAPDYQSVAR